MNINLNINVSFSITHAWGEHVKEPMENVQKDIKFASNISLVVATIVFSLIAIFLNIVYFQDRLSEYGLLLSLGVSRFQIIKKSFSENFFIIIVSWIAGLLLSKIFLELMASFLFIPKGWFLDTFPVDVLPDTLPIPIGMLICGLLVVIYKIRKLDPVEIIEKRW